MPVALAPDGRRTHNATIQGIDIGFDAKERGRPIRVRLGFGGAGGAPVLWTWRSEEDVAAGRALSPGQDCVAVSGQDAYDYCAGSRIKNPESDRALEILRAYRGSSGYKPHVSQDNTSNPHVSQDQEPR